MPIESSARTVRAYTVSRRKRKITINAPSKVKVGKTFNVTGKLTEDNKGLGGKTVNLYIEGSRESSTKTSSDGSYSFSVRFTSRGSYRIHTEAEVSPRVRVRRGPRGRRRIPVR